jgi:TetR/AcrR family transcriptional regulator, transcriptional repressor for nem operon
MGRSTKEEAARTRARIVEKASELFRTSGVDQVSVAEVMNALGLTVGGFYKHFESKDALVAEAMDLSFDRASASWEAVAQKANLKGLDPRVAIVRHYQQARSPEHRCPMLAFAPHASRDAREAARDRFADGAGALLDRFGTTVVGGAPTPKRDTETLVVFAAMIGAQILSQAAGSAPWMAELRQAVEAAAGELG